MLFEFVEYTTELPSYHDLVIVKQRPSFSQFSCITNIRWLSLLWRFFCLADTGRKLSIYKAYRIRPGRLLNILCTFNLRSVSTECICGQLFFSVILLTLMLTEVFIHFHLLLSESLVPKLESVVVLTFLAIKGKMPSLLVVCRFWKCFIASLNLKFIGIHGVVFCLCLLILFFFVFIAFIIFVCIICILGRFAVLQTCFYAFCWLTH